MRKEIILSVDNFTLVKTGDHIIPYAWEADFGEGPVYYHGSATRERAEAWAISEGIMDEPAPKDEQGEL